MADIPAALAEALRDRYLLERELGRGGMARVYVARDLKHGRAVALKVLRPELASALGAERFQREIATAARLQHPHILSVHDSGETAGQLWFTMPFVEGESLRERLRREGQLPLEDAVRITTETARALDYAHRQGIVHRDIEPENILLTKDGDTLVADFGIARALRGEDDPRLTETGLVVGTPAYMSPEQAAAERTLDARTDIYSLGAVLYEMLAGEPPYSAPTTEALLLKRLADPVPSVRRVRSLVPEPIDHAVQKALAPTRADRFATAADFAVALHPSATTPAPTVVATAAVGPPFATTPASASPVPRSRRLVGAITLGVGVLMGVGGLFVWRRSQGPAAEAAGPRVVAVLPFENLGDSAEAYFADGVTNDVRTKLAMIEGLAVIARGSSNEYRHTSKSPQVIARELGADYLLTGTIQWEQATGGPSRVRVSPELVDIGPGHAPRTRWSEQFDAALTDVFQVQADIAGKVASALNVALGDSARRQLAGQPTRSLAAYDTFLKGEAAWQAGGAPDPESRRRAIGFYEQAVRLDSAFVPALAQLARMHAALYAISAPRPAEVEQARQAAEQAQALGPTRPEGYLALGDYYRNVQGDNERALAAYEAGLRLAPNNVELLAFAGIAEENSGRWDSAVQRLARAAALDPRSAITARRYGYALLDLRRYSDAEVAGERALVLAPADLDAIRLNVMVALARGDLTRAQAVVRTALGVVEPAILVAYLASYDDLYWVLDNAQQQQLLTLPPSSFDNDRGNWAIVRAQVYHLQGETARARVYADSARLAFEEQLRTAPDDGQRHVFRGLGLAYLGRKAEAIREGERAVALWPLTRDAYWSSYIRHQIVRIYLLVGEPEKALDQLEPLLTVPYYLSPARLRIDPNFTPLKGNPRFEGLVAGK